MAQKSVKKRIKITKSGKMKRRATTLGHSRVNKSKTQMLRKRKYRNLLISKKTIKKYV